MLRPRSRQRLLLTETGIVALGLSSLIGKKRRGTRRAVTSGYPDARCSVGGEPEARVGSIVRGTPAILAAERMASGGLSCGNASLASIETKPSRKRRSRSRPGFSAGEGETEPGGAPAREEKSWARVLGEGGTWLAPLLYIGLGWAGPYRFYHHTLAGRPCMFFFFG